MAGRRSRVAVSEAVQSRFRELAASGRALLRDLHAEAVLSLVKLREPLPDTPDEFHYLVNPRNGENQNVELDAALWKRIDRITRRDRVSARTFIYTALVRWLDQMR